MDYETLVMAIGAGSGSGGGGTQIQSDWNQSDNTKVDYIKNKPTIEKKLPAQTLSAGSTTLTFSDSSITADSLIDVYSPVWYSNAVQSAGSVVFTFPVQSADISVQIKVG